jgi:hypothetical protein
MVGKVETDNARATQLRKRTGHCRRHGGAFSIVQDLRNTLHSAIPARQTCREMLIERRQSGTVFERMSWNETRLERGRRAEQSGRRRIDVR